jgi:hypothetical protein
MASTDPSDKHPRFPWGTVASNILVAGLAQGAGYGLAGVGAHLIGTKTNLADKLSPEARARIGTILRGAAVSLPPLLIGARQVAMQQRVLDAQEEELERWRKTQANKEKVAAWYWSTHE